VGPLRSAGCRRRSAASGTRPGRLPPSGGQEMPLHECASTSPPRPSRCSENRTFRGPTGRRLRRRRVCRRRGCDQTPAGESRRARRCAGGDRGLLPPLGFLLLAAGDRPPGWPAGAGPRRFGGGDHRSVRTRRGPSAAPGAARPARLPAQVERALGRMLRFFGDAVSTSLSASSACGTRAGAAGDESAPGESLVAAERVHSLPGVEAALKRGVIGSAKARVLLPVGWRTGLSAVVGPARDHPARLEDEVAGPRVCETGTAGPGPAAGRAARGGEGPRRSGRKGSRSAEAIASVLA